MIATRIPGKAPSRTKLFSHTWLAGLALLIERPSQRVEQCSYVWSFAGDSFYKTFLTFFPTLKQYPKLHQVLTVGLWCWIFGAIGHVNQTQWPIFGKLMGLN